jgi:PAS domain S-box-containing protein
VKAIRMHEGQANVVPQRCISCGTCVRECPQGAKSYRRDLDRARELFGPGQRVAASVAPSLAAVFPAWQRRRLPSALRQLGFAYVGETAIGAYHVAMATARAVERRPGQSHVCTACPAVVRFVERYRPKQTGNLVPVVSPMLAHARHIRRLLADSGEVRVIFIGPCVAKKAEADRPENEGLVDCVLTFGELAEWFQQEKIDLAACEESDFDEKPCGAARLFPLAGGSVRTSGWTADLLAETVVTASGYEEICTLLDSIAPGGVPRVIEPLFCKQGCINGPAMPGDRNVFLCRGDVLDYAAGGEGEAEADPPPELATRFTADQVDAESTVSEEQIRKVLTMTGKAKEDDQLNCGACGYASCRDKAVAVIRCMAEPEMCIPHMKRLAEQRVDRIIETSPNGIVVLDEHLRILHMNPAFQKFFMCSEALCGQPVACLIDPEPFVRLASGEEQRIEMTAEYKKYGLVCHQILYPLREEKQYVGIMVNITHHRASQQKLDHLRSQTVIQARELLEHQIEMAQRLAQFLGESTAQGEDLVEKLMQLADEVGESKAESKGQTVQEIYGGRPGRG